MNAPEFPNAPVAPAVGIQLDIPVGRLAPERATECGLTECAGKPMCPRCVCRKARADGMPSSPDERTLRRLLAARTGMPNLYWDDGEASGEEHGIRIDFMRDSAIDIGEKLRALNIARARSAPKDLELRRAVVSLRADFGPLGTNYPAVRKLVEFAERAIAAGEA